MLALLPEVFWVVPLSVFTAGLIGSSHCLSMCGPIVINFARQRKDLVSYQIGRITSYTLAGALVGGFGKILFKNQEIQWLSRLSLLFIAFVLLINGYRIFRGKSLHLPVPQFINQFTIKAWRKMRLFNWPGYLMAGSAGFLTLFFPCGHLYSFLIGAMATGSSMGGAIFMFAFALGSAPLLSLGSQWLQKFIQSRQQSRQRLAGIFLLGAGLVSLILFSTRHQNHSPSHLPASPPAVHSHEAHGH